MFEAIENVGTVAWDMWIRSGRAIRSRQAELVDWFGLRLVVRRLRMVRARRIFGSCRVLIVVWLKKNCFFFVCLFVFRS